MEFMQIYLADGSVLEFMGSDVNSENFDPSKDIFMVGTGEDGKTSVYVNRSHIKFIKWTHE